MLQIIKYTTEEDVNALTTNIKYIKLTRFKLEVVDKAENQNHGALMRLKVPPDKTLGDI